MADEPESGRRLHASRTQLADLHRHARSNASGTKYWAVFTNTIGTTTNTERATRPRSPSMSRPGRQPARRRILPRRHDGDPQRHRVRLPHADRAVAIQHRRRQLHAHPGGDLDELQVHRHGEHERLSGPRLFTNPVGQANSNTVTLTVTQAPSITSASSAAFTVGQAGSFNIIAAGCRRRPSP